jgi:hypothetical protein
VDCCVFGHSLAFERQRQNGVLFVDILTHVYLHKACLIPLIVYAEVAQFNLAELLLVGVSFSVFVEVGVPSESL